MRIGIDCSSLLSIKTGIGYYTHNLVKNLLKIDTKNQYVLFFNSYSKKLKDREFFDKPNVKIKKWSIPGPLMLKGWKYLNFPPMDLFTGKVDVFHSPSGYIAPLMRGKKVLTLHDIYFAKHPENTALLGGKYLAETLPKKLPLVDFIITDSLFTKKEIIAEYNVDPSKIKVIYPGVSKDFKKIDDEKKLEAVRNEYCLPRDFILCVSTLEPRKNIEGLILAYKRLKDIINKPPSLLIVGDKGWQYEEIFNMVNSLSLSNDVIFTGYVSDEILPIIYNLALFLVYPSFYEGFGLPVVEAMACGLPVITSNTSSLKEIASGVAEMVDPNNYMDMAALMKKMILSNKLRESLSHKSLTYIRNFSWESCAKQTLECYENCVNEK